MTLKIFGSILQYFLNFVSISKYNPSKTNNKFTDEFEKKTNYCVWFGHSLWSAISCQRKWLTSFVPKLQYFLSFEYI